MKHLSKYLKQKNMNHKQFISVFIITVFFGCCISAKAQNCLDTIKIRKSGSEMLYYYQGKMIPPYQLIVFAPSNSIEEKFFKEAHTLHATGLLLDGIGGVLFGVSIGHSMYKASNQEPVNWAVLLPLLGIGSGFIICGISFEVMAKQRILVGAKTFNNSVKQKSNTALNLGLSTKGMLLKLNF